MAMKINTRAPGSKPGLVKETPPQMTDGGYTYLEPQRFKRASDLFNRFKSIQEIRGDMASWQSIMTQYNRIPYKKRGGRGVMPNFGFLRGKIDQAATVYTDYATERPRWVSCKTDFGDTQGLCKLYSEEITNAFQRFYIEKWDDRFAQILLAVRDMLLFSKGALAFLEPDCPYPESIDTKSVWPDSNAGMFAKSFDVLFVQKRLSAVELFRKMSKQHKYNQAMADSRLTEDEQYKASGWRRSAVLRLLRGVGTLSSYTNDDLYKQFTQGSLSQTDQDTSIDLVYCYVQEYHEKDLKKVSLFVIPSETSVPRPKRNGRVLGLQESYDSVGYLCYDPYYKVEMEEAISILAHTVCRNFYEDPSLAELWYTTAKTYDIVMNRVLQGCEDNMRVFLKSKTSDEAKKLAKHQFDNYQVLPPSIDIVQDRIERPVKESMDVLTRLVMDTTMNNSQYQPGGEAATNRETATGEQRDIFEGTRADASSLKIFNCYMTLASKQMYRRFVTMDPKGEGEYYDNFRKFMDYLKSRKVPDQAWQPGNVSVTSLPSSGAGNPAARIQAGQITLNALAAPARSPGEREAQREIIAAVQGRDNVPFFLPDDEKLQIPEDSKIGLENDALSQPWTNPQNIPVLGTDLHFRHLPAHLQDAQASFQMAAQLFQNLQQFNPDDVGIHLQNIQDILLGVDRKLSHCRAHIVMAGRAVKGKPQKEELEGFKKQIQSINVEQDKLEHNLKQIQDKRMKEAGRNRGGDPAAAHKQRMNDLEFQHTQRMNGLDEERQVSKATQLREQSAENSVTRLNMETLATRHKIERQTMESEAKIARQGLEKNNGKTKK
jgi:hypothetical protein